MINLNTVDAMTRSMRSTFESSELMEVDPELFKKFLEQLIPEVQPPKIVIEPSEELPKIKKEDSLQIDEQFVYPNQILFSFIPNQENPKLLAFSAKQEKIFASEQENTFIEKNLTGDFSLTQKEANLVEDFISKNSEQIELHMTKITNDVKEVSQNIFLNDRFLVTEGESTQTLKIKNQTSTEGFILKEQVETTSEELEVTPKISFESADNQMVFTNTPIFKEQPILSKMNLSYNQPEQFVHDLSEKIQVSIKNATKETNQVIQVKLSPENLGEMEIHLEWQDNHVEAKIFVQEQNLKELLEIHFQQLLPKESFIHSFTIAVIPQQATSYQFSQDLGQRKSLMQSFKTNSGRLKREKKEISKHTPYKLSYGLSLYM